MRNTACCGTLDSSTFGGTLQPFKVGSCCTSDMDNPNMKNERYKSPSTLKEGPNCANWAGVVESLPAQGSKSTQLPATNVCWRSWSCENSAASSSGRSANQGSLKRMLATSVAWLLACGTHARSLACPFRLFAIGAHDVLQYITELAVADNPQWLPKPQPLAVKEDGNLKYSRE